MSEIPTLQAMRLLGQILDEEGSLDGVSAERIRGARRLIAEIHNTWEPRYESKYKHGFTNGFEHAVESMQELLENLKPPEPRA